jgi:xylulokinase
MKLVIGADLGTSGCKAAAYDTSGREICSTVRFYPTQYPRDGLHEQALADWWTAFSEAIQALVGQLGHRSQQITGIALSGQSLAMIPLNHDGDALLDNVPIWSDTRAQSQCDDYFTRVEQATWYQRTGNGFPPALYTLFKVMWLRDHQPDVYQKASTVVGSKDWINLRLTGKIRTDPSYASGFGAFDLLGGAYANDLLAPAGVPEELLPRIVPSTDVVGVVLPDVARALGLPRSVAVVAGGVDNSCMALGALNTKPGSIYASLGSSSWLTLCDTKPVLDETLRPFVFAHVVPGLYNSAISTFSAGTSATWAIDTFFPSMDGNIDALVDLALSANVGSSGVIFVPSISGGTVFEGGPVVRGSLTQLSAVHGPQDVARAIIEAIPMALRRPLDRLREITHVHDSMMVTGGGARNAAWLQIYSDILGARLVKTNVDQQAATLGAAALALVGTGLWDSFAPLESSHTVEEQFNPAPDKSRIYTEEVLPRFTFAANQSLEFSKFRPNAG